MKNSGKILLICLLISMFWPVVVQAQIALPDIPATQFPITNYGASTSNSDNSAAINAAVSAANSAGGGTVVIPDGTFLSGPVTMKSNVNLFLSSGAVLQMMPYGDGNGSPAGSYPNDGTTDSYAYFIYGENLSNIEVGGTGTIDGDGSAWWTAYEANKNIHRPYLIRFKACDTVLIKDITLKDSPNVHICLGRSGSGMGSNGIISHVTIIAPANSPNTDAIDTWYWDGVNIEDCNLSEGDDNVAMDSYSHNINIKNCTFGNGHGVSVGSYAVSVHNVTVDSCTFNGTTNGIRLKSNRTRGGQDSSFTYSNITMNNVKYPFYITSWYDKEPYPASAQTAAAVTSTTPLWKNITFKNITVTNSTYAGIIYGLPEMYVDSVIFDNVQIGANQKGLITNFVSGLVFKNCSSVTIPGSAGNAIVPYDAKITGINQTTGASTSCSPTAVSYIKAVSSVSCFPDPLRGDDFTVQASNGISKVWIYNLAGFKIKEQNGNLMTHMTVDVKGLAAGYYIVNVMSGREIHSLKLIKE
ncbi:MAG: T9SS type A sorting domain-containing protein [Bacteroidales bacterium]|nr:T9SS type A sorting domain-containing protein [Bacteroidales bacterium]